MGSIYRIINLKNGKNYIGMTINNPYERFKEHIRSSKRGDGYYLHNSIRKHGRENFLFGIIVDNIPDHLLPIFEKYWIQYYKSFGNGYNLTEGGEFGKIEPEIRKEAEIKRQQTNIKKYGGTTPTADSEIVKKRLETLGEEGLKENGRKISKALKNKVYSYNILENKYEHIDKNIFDNTWYYVGRTAKYLTYYLYKDKIYLSRELVEKDSNHIRKRGSARTPFKTIRIPIEKIKTSIEEYVLLFNDLN
jgi:group I intron endonuclease